MANYTSNTRMISGTPGGSVDAQGNIVITLTANSGYRFDNPHGLLIVDNANIFDENDLGVRSADGSTVTFTLSVRDDIRFPDSSENIRIRISGDAILIRNRVDVSLGGGDTDTNGAGGDDSDISFEDMHGNGPLDTLDVNVEGDQGDEFGVGNAVICPVGIRRFVEDADGNIILPHRPRDRQLGNGAILRYSNPTVNDEGCLVYAMTVIIGSSDSDGISGGGEGTNLTNRGGNGGGNQGTFDNVFNIDSNGNNDPTGGGSEDIPDEDRADIPEDDIYEINIDSDNLDPLQGGFIIITATGTPGATGTVTLTPNVIGTGSLPDSIGVITVNIVIEANGIYTEVVRIPSVAGDENVNPLCETEAPDGVDGINWDVEAMEGEDSIPTDTESIMQDEGGELQINVVSSDSTIDLIEGATSSSAGWEYSTVIQGERGYSFEQGIIRISIPPRTGEMWTLVDDEDGVVNIDPDTDITCTPRNVIEFCDGTCVIDNSGNLILTQPYGGGVIPNELHTCEIDLDNLATQNTEVSLTWTVPSDAHYTISSSSQSVFSYSGMPGTAIPADGGEIPTSITLVADAGYTWHMVDFTNPITVSVPSGANNDDATVHFTNFTVTPSTRIDLVVREVTVSWTLTGNFRTSASLPPIRDVFNAVANFNANYISTVDFNIGTDRRGQMSLDDATFEAIAPEVGIEGEAWTANYSITPDTGHVIKSTAVPTGVLHSDTTDTGVTVSTATFASSSSATGTITGTFKDVDHTIYIDGSGQGFAEVDVEFRNRASLSGLNVSRWAQTYTDVVEGDVIRQKYTITLESGKYFDTEPTISFTGGTHTDTAFTTVTVDGTSRVVGLNGYVDYTIPDGDATVDLTTSGGDIDDIPVSFTIMVVSTPDGVADVTPIALTLSEVDGANADPIPGRDVPFSFELATDGQRGWDRDDISTQIVLPTVENVVFDALSPDSNVLSDPLSDPATAATGIVTVSGTYTVPNDHEGGDPISFTITIGGTGPVELITIDFVDSGGDPLEDDIDFGDGDGESVSFDITVDSQGQTPAGWSSEVTDGDGNPLPDGDNGGFSITPAPGDDVTTDGTTTVTIETDGENESVTEENVVCYTISSRVTGVDVSKTIKLVQGTADPLITVHTNPVVFGPSMGDTAVFSFTSNDNWEIPAGSVPAEEFEYVSGGTLESDGRVTGGPGSNIMITYRAARDITTPPDMDHVTIRTTSTITSRGATIVPFVLDQTTLFEQVRAQLNLLITDLSRAPLNPITFNHDTANVSIVVRSNSFGLDPEGWTASVTGPFSLSRTTQTTDGDVTLTITPDALNTSVSSENTGVLTVTSRADTSLSVTRNLLQRKAPITLTPNPLPTVVSTSAGIGGTGTLSFNVNDNWEISGWDTDDFTVAGATGDTITGSPGANSVTWTNRRNTFIERAIESDIIFRTTTAQADLLAGQSPINFVNLTDVRQTPTTRTLTLGGTNVIPNGTVVDVDVDKEGNNNVQLLVDSNDTSLTWTASVSADPTNSTGTSTPAGVSQLITLLNPDGTMPTGASVSGDEGESLRFQVRSNPVGTDTAYARISITFYDENGDAIFSRRVQVELEENPRTLTLGGVDMTQSGAVLDASFGASGGSGNYDIVTNDPNLTWRVAVSADPTNADGTMTPAGVSALVSDLVDTSTPLTAASNLTFDVRRQGLSAATAYARLSITFLSNGVVLFSRRVQITLANSAGTLTVDGMNMFPDGSVLLRQFADSGVKTANYDINSDDDQLTWTASISATATNADGTMNQPGGPVITLLNPDGTTVGSALNSSTSGGVGDNLRFTVRENPPGADEVFGRISVAFTSGDNTFTRRVTAQLAEGTLPTWPPADLAVAAGTARAFEPRTSGRSSNAAVTFPAASSRAFTSTEISKYGFFEITGDHRRITSSDMVANRSQVTVASVPSGSISSDTTRTVRVTLFAPDDGTYSNPGASMTFNVTIPYYNVYYTLAVGTGSQTFQVGYTSSATTLTAPSGQTNIDFTTNDPDVTHCRLGRRFMNVNPVAVTVGDDDITKTVSFGPRSYGSSGMHDHLFQDRSGTSAVNVIGNATNGIVITT